MRIHTAPLAVEVVRADARDGWVTAVLSLTADRDVLVEGGVGLVRMQALTRRERNWNGAGFTVGRRSETVLDRLRLDVPDSRAAGHTHRVEVVLCLPPTGEASVAGWLVQRYHAVRARFRAGGHDGEATREVHVPFAPDATELSERPAVIDDAGAAVLGVEDGAQLRLYGGVAVRGTVTVAPLVAEHARRIRLDLLLEHVPAVAGEPQQEDLDSSTVVASVTPAEHLQLVPGHTLRLPFTLQPPDPLPSPSVRTPDLVVRWVLQAVLDRALRRDPRVTLEVPAATTG